MPEIDYTLLIRLVAAAVLGGIVGLERSGAKQNAGIRTHMILCLGAAGAMVLGQALALLDGNIDMTRLGAQVISGVGFLGAGNIILNRNRVKGITTAAGLWTTAIIGLVVGAGYYIYGVAMVALVLVATLGLRDVSRWLSQRDRQYILCMVPLEESDLQPVFRLLEKEKIRIVGVRYYRQDSNGQLCTKFKVAKSKRH